MSDIEEVPAEYFAKLKKSDAMGELKAKRSGASSLAERRGDEAAAQRANDGRVRASKADKKGYYTKNRVIDYARAHGMDMSGVVEEALFAYLKAKEQQ